MGWVERSWPDIGGGSGCGKTAFPCSETGSPSTPCWRLSSVFEYIPSTQLRGSNVGGSPHSGVEDDGSVPFLPHPPVQSHKSN